MMTALDHEHPQEDHHSSSEPRNCGVPSSHCLTGTLITWGEATVADHEVRRDLFLMNAQANIEGAARHSAAIHQFEAAVAKMRNELIKVAV
jgi:hypothetical protein